MSVGFGLERGGKFTEGKRGDHFQRILAPETGTAVSFISSLPHPLLAFGTLLFVNLCMIFAWFFIDPQLPFYVFDELGWSTAQFGAAISFYGWATLVRSLALGQSSDRWRRKPVLIVGHGFAGLNYSYQPDLGAELQYWCAAK